MLGTGLRWLSAAGVLLAGLGWAADKPAPRKTIELTPNAALRLSAISPNGEFIAGACKDGKIRVWEISSGKLIRTLELGQSGSDAESIQFSHDGTVLAAGGHAANVRLWSLSTGELKDQLTTGAPVDVVALSPDLRLVAIAPAELPLEIWSLPEHKILAKLPAKFSGSAALAFSANGKWLASADSDTEIRIIDLDKMAIRTTVDEVLMETFAIAFTPDSSLLLAGGADQVLTAIEPATGKVIRRFVGETWPVSNVCISRDGRSLGAIYFDAYDSAAPAPALVWDFSTGSVRGRLSPAKIHFGGGASVNAATASNQCEFASDGKLLLAGGQNQLEVWTIQ
jgi:WD40 repeat protein